MKTRPLLVGISEAARALGLSSSGIRRLMQAGQLPTVRIGARRLFRLADLEALAQEGAPMGSETAKVEEAP